MHTSEVYWKGQARAILDAAEAWKDDDAEPHSGLNFAASLDHPLATAAALQKLARLAWDDLFSGRLARSLETGVRLRELFRLTAQAVERLAEVLRTHKNPAGSVASAEEVERAARDLRATAADIEARWPSFDVEELKALCAEETDFVDPEEIYRDLPEIRRQGQP